ncbi:hypothetical protein BGZ65_005573 [Modicella reniformis]|uniref:FAD-binding domain-containing protein n=1 Tax=Modicella reniformis TaxID=1440133 RepID=A0A9P6IK79_9FUNG|nr:hypothetical protein BGZ65_005573 [Modicella reniformis]
MPRLQILIAGGGLGGLALAIMLERLPEPKKVDYLILERSTFSNPMGSAISLHASVIPLLKQLGVWAEIEKVSKPMSHFSIKREDGSDLGNVDFAYGQLDYTYYGMVLARPDFHEILLSHVPSEKILNGKRIVSTSQDDFGVSCHCADGSIYHGDILIGADGAYSAVRQSLYRDLKAHGNLPRQDFSPIKLDQVVVVGITESLNPTAYPLLKEDVCQFRVVLGGRDKAYTMWMVPLTNNRIAWSIGGRSDAPAGSSFWSESQQEATATFGQRGHQNSRFPDWGETESDSIEEICAQVRPMRNPFGYGTYGDLINSTPKHLISRVMFEEKGFKTWYGGRTVLVGDGVVNAIFDGACLVNLIHDLHGYPTMDDLGDLFQSYFERRYPAAQIAIQGSSQFLNLFHDQAQVEEDGRIVMFNSIPRWLQRWTLDKTKRVDPRLEFLLARMSKTSSSQSLATILDKNDEDDNKDSEASSNNETNGISSEINSSSNSSNSNNNNNVSLNGTSTSNGMKGHFDIDNLILINQLSLHDKTTNKTDVAEKASSSSLSLYGSLSESLSGSLSESLSESLSGSDKDMTDSSSLDEIVRGRTIEIAHSSVVAAASSLE